jgi:hypothetical protein
VNDVCPYGHVLRRVHTNFCFLTLDSRHAIVSVIYYRRLCTWLYLWHGDERRLHRRHFDIQKAP